MTNGKRVLLIDDDDALRETLSEQLRLHEEFTITSVEDGRRALELTKQDYYDVIILDVGLPDMDGREVCRLMRRSGVKSPIIMLTGADTDADTILALDSGANDYVTKPFRLAVLLARLRAHIRQHERSDDAVFTIGPYSFQPANKLLIDRSPRPPARIPPAPVRQARCFATAATLPRRTGRRSRDGRWVDSVGTVRSVPAPCANVFRSSAGAESPHPATA